MSIREKGWQSFGQLMACSTRTMSEKTQASRSFQLRESAATGGHAVFGFRQQAEKEDWRRFFHSEREHPSSKLGFDSIAPQAR